MKIESNVNYKQYFGSFKLNKDSFKTDASKGWAQQIENLANQNKEIISNIEDKGFDIKCESTNAGMGINMTLTHKGVGIPAKVNNGIFNSINNEFNYPNGEKINREFDFFLKKVEELIKFNKIKKLFNF